MEILDHLLKLSSSHSNKVYTSDIVFYGKRFYDDNIFFTALIAYTLKEIKHTFVVKNQHKIDQILENSEHAFSFYENKHTGITYNFYPTKPLNQYAGIKFLNKFTALHIPDDVDTTSFVYLSKTKLLKQEVHDVKHKLESLSYDGKVLKSIPKKYRSTKAYRTWFATKMNHDMDVCVLCNALTFMYKQQVLLTEVDQDSISFISQLLQENTLFKQAYLFSPHYKNKAIVLYHIARLVAVSQHPKLTQHTVQLIQEAKSLLQTTKNAFEKIVIITSLYKLGDPLLFDVAFDKSALDQFYWFKANPFSIAAPWVKMVFSRNKFLHLEYQCEAYYWVLLLELKQISKATLKISEKIVRIHNSL